MGKTRSKCALLSDRQLASRNNVSRSSSNTQCRTRTPEHHSCTRMHGKSVKESISYRRAAGSRDSKRKHHHRSYTVSSSSYSTREVSTLGTTAEQTHHTRWTRSRTVCVVIVTAILCMNNQCQHHRYSKNTGESVYTLLSAA